MKESYIDNVALFFAYDTIMCIRNLGLIIKN